MTERNYPTHVSEIEAWSRAKGVSTQEGRTRFAEFVIVSCLAANRVARGALVLKGGNALRLAHRSPRSTKDLDFTAQGNAIADDPEEVRQLLDRALGFAHRRFEVKARCQRVKRNPKAPKATRPTYDVAVGYQLPGDRYFHSFEHRTVSTTIPLEISLNDLVCEMHPWIELDKLQVCSLEDILAEKLRSLLQQKTRNRYRWQDVYDVSRFARAVDVDRAKISEFLKRKAAIREIEVSKSAFDEEVRYRAKQGYDDGMARLPASEIIPFDEAWQTVRSLVESLDIPA